MVDMLIVASVQGGLGGAAFAIAIGAFSMAVRNHYRIEKLQKALSGLDHIAKGHDGAY